MNELLAEYPVVIEQVVDWGDMDAFQHVNNVVYFRYFENARVVYFAKLDWVAYLDQTGIGPIVSTAVARFRRPVTHPDTLLVGVRVSNILHDRYLMQYRIVSQRHNIITTEGETEVVTYHYQERKKVAIPEELRKRIQSIESISSKKENG